MADDDLTPENIDEFMKKAAADADAEALKETWAQFNSIYKAMLLGGFSPEQANAILIELMWKLIQEGNK